MHFIDEATPNVPEYLGSMGWTLPSFVFGCAGEYISDEWAATLQGEGIRVSMTAAEARMEKDRAIDTLEEFSHCLRHAFSAKNSLSRVNGFTPEQCLLGKSRKLPGSLTADSDASSHSLAESSLPERVRFKENLSRREHAWKAFVQAGNDSFFRRALLRQSRPGKVEYEAGDWVLYWRKTKGGSRIERAGGMGPHK